MKMSEDKAFYENLHDVSVNLKDVSTNAKELVDNLNKGNISKLSNDKELYARLDRVSTRLDSVMERIEKGEGSAGKLLSDEKLYNNMNKFFEDADSLVLDLKKRPEEIPEVLGVLNSPPLQMTAARKGCHSGAKPKNPHLTL